jgi:hypothetical protein
MLSCCNIISSDNLVTINDHHKFSIFDKKYPVFLTMERQWFFPSKTVKCSYLIVKFIIIFNRIVV